jgi:glycosyltransferase involved in cell wall biosynthesis
VERRPRFRRVKPRPFLLTPRDRTIVEFVAEYRILSSEQIVALLVEGSPQVILRRLSLLYHGRYLDRPRSQIEDLLRFTGSRPMAYALGTAGAALLGLKPPKPVKLQFVDHTLGVSSVLVAFTRACREHGNVRVIPWREILEEKVPEERRRKKEPDSWKVRLPDDTTVGVKPDAIFGLHYLDKPEGANRAYFFLEVDRGTMPVMRAGLSQTSVYRKLLAYHATAAAGLQITLFGFKTFRVLTVTRSPEKKRLDSLVEAAGKLPGLHGLFLFGEEKTLLDGDVLTSEWRSGKKESTTLVR